MKLIFSSISDEAVFNTIKEHLDKPLDQIKILVIPTAMPVSVRERKILKGVAKHGFSEENITVFNHKKAENFRNLNIDVVYACGGNTFLLLKHLRQCGFDQDIADYIKKGATYIGASAGAHLVTKDTHHLIPIDGNDKVLEGITDFTALGLFDGILFCHFGPDRQHFYEKAVAENKYKVHTLTNHEIMVVDNDKTIKVNTNRCQNS